MNSTPRGASILHGGLLAHSNPLVMREDKPLELRTTLLAILDEAMQVDDAARGKIRIYNPDSGRLEVRVQRGFSDGFLDSFGAIAQDEPLACARAFRTRRRVVVADVARDALPEDYRAAARQEGFQALQSTPVIGSGGRVLGTLVTHFPGVHLPSQSAAMVLDYLSRKAAGAIEALLGSDLKKN